MEGLPRAPHNGDRRVASRESRAESTHRQLEEQQQVSEYQSRAPRSGGGFKRDDHETASKKGIILTIAIAAVVIILGLVAWFVFAGAKSEPTGIDKSRYQAIFLSNGQVYFGNLEDFSSTSFKLTTIYYPKTSSEDAGTNAATQAQSSNIQLIRLGDEVHAPDNEMYLSKSQVLYYENLKADGKVSQLMKQNENSK